MDPLAVIEEMRACDGRNGVEVVRLVEEVCRRRLWDGLPFRSSNGITHLYKLLALEACVLSEAVDIEEVCRAITTAHRHYVVHSESIQRFLFCIVSTLPMERAASSVGILRGTLETTLVSFTLFLQKHVCDHTASAVHKMLRTHVFPNDASALRHVPVEWGGIRATREPVEAAKTKTCPITLDAIVDGVVASDGHLYERLAIMTHMAMRRESPMTREYLDLDFVTWNENV